VRIAFDTSQTKTRPAGCGHFARGLLDGLLGLAAEDAFTLLPAFGADYWDAAGLRACWTPRDAAVRVGPLPASLDESRRFWRRAGAEVEAELGHPDVIHSNNFFCPRGLPSARLVYTLYDLAFLREPRHTTEENYRVCFDGVFQACLEADAIVCISEATRRDLLDTFPHYPSERTAVVAPASRLAAAPARRPESLPDLEPGGFLLSVGTLEPRKHHRLLVDAHAAWCRGRGGGPPLVLAGARGWLSADLDRALGGSTPQAQVHVTGYVDDACLAWLYANCRVFVFPSLDEGFGMPCLEAMGLGAPVIATRAGALPEVLADAGRLVEPGHRSDLELALEEVWSDEGERGRMSAAGRLRASSFSWAESARRTRSVYADALERPKLSARFVAA
jgi:glycosyltransferase involved in cell wall biosynthesis